MRYLIYHIKKYLWGIFRKNVHERHESCPFETPREGLYMINTIKPHLDMIFVSGTMNITPL